MRRLTITMIRLIPFGNGSVVRQSSVSNSRWARVLDVYCGSGASALPAAEMVGPQGFVLGIDLAANLLELARTKAAKRGLMNTQFRVGDLLDMHLSDTQFDAVICVFGIFLSPICRQLFVRSGTRFVVEASLQ
jgi:ubiquinone/menaquinone biosynthesis C-methylase UbiE